jgi:tRNA threonylcarbamoyladenosine biosynthesis protein TsaE
MTIDDHQRIVKKIAWDNEAQTTTFAQTLAKKIIGSTSGRNALIQLHGDLGAGKTTFARHLLQALGVPGRIKSPTYAVVEPYSVATGTSAGDEFNIWHFDFYRFNDPNEWDEAGFRDIFASVGLKLVEWPEKAGQHLPRADLDIHIEVLDNDKRSVTLSAPSDSHGDLLP